MWRNYLTVAWRFLLADRVFTFVNLFGLAVGLASVVIISLHVTHAFSSDRWLPAHESLFRIDTTESTPGRDPLDIARSPGPLKDELLKSFPQIEDISRAYPATGNVVREGRPYREPLMVADPNFFSLLRLPLLSGNGATALSGTGSVALSTRAALKYFGREDVVGARLTIAAPSPRDFIVSAIFPTLPDNSHMAFDIVIPAAAYFPRGGEEIAGIPDNWGGAYFFTYARLRRGADVHAIESDLPALVDRSLPQWLTGLLSVPPHEFYRFRFVPVRDILFDGGAIGAARPKQSRTTLLALSAVALLILAVATINFANLTTARSTLRAREVALRKVVGASRLQILTQFMGEAIILAGFAGLLGLSLVELSLPYVASLLGLPPTLAPQMDWRVWAGAALVVLVTAIMSGFYPSLVLSRIRPAALFNRGQAAAQSGPFREALVVAQFAVSIALITATAIMMMQMHHTRNAELNFDSDNLLVVRLPEETDSGAAAGLKERFARLAGVTDVALSSAVPSDPSEDNLSIDRPGEAKPLQLGFHRVDGDFFRTYGVRPLAGRAESAIVRDEGSAAALINEAALKRLGYSSAAQAIGEVIRSSKTEYRLVGVVPDLKFRSLHSAVRDELFILDEAPGRVLTIRFATGNLPAFLAEVDRTWRQRLPHSEIDRAFLGASLDELYAEENRQARLLAIFSAIAILISSLGLLAMAAFAVQRRARELALRKVLGAGTADLLRALLWGSLRPVLAANLIAWPVAWWAMRNWLNGFDVRIDLGPAPFVLASLFAAAVAVGTVAGQALKAARANPINALRYE
jgi:putative ABC transport system permease protein